MMNGDTKCCPRHSSNPQTTSSTAFSPTSLSISITVLSMPIISGLVPTHIPDEIPHLGAYLIPKIMWPKYVRIIYIISKASTAILNLAPYITVGPPSVVQVAERHRAEVCAIADLEVKSTWGGRVEGAIKCIDDIRGDKT